METNQQFSSNNREMRRFIFNRLQQIDNQKALYTLRLISKSEQERVEKKIQTAKINYCDIEKFATSKFSARIKFLEVCFRFYSDSVESFKYLSNTYLPYALKINAKVFPSFYEYNRVDDALLHIRLNMSEPLTFQRLHIVNYGWISNICITGKYNVEIRDCEFMGIGVRCKGNAKVYVTGSKFINGIYGLKIIECDSVYIDDISLDNCKQNELTFESIKEVINITNIRVFSCGYFGILLNQNTAKFKLSNTIIKDCEIGIGICGSCSGEIQKTNIEGCRYSGIWLSGGAIVHYSAVEFKHNRKDVLIDDDHSQFLPLENIQ